ncbi:hypothetical protein PG997_008752 [Apiospora hydei]|uniref:Uncharacterized protein n=1 Tax=Apiospora hydei TaxID=1337664 RepID=A0ABR1WBP8_9PEZI
MERDRWRVAEGRGGPRRVAKKDHPFCISDVLPPISQIQTTPGDASRGLEWLRLEGRWTAAVAFVQGVLKPNCRHPPTGKMKRASDFCWLGLLVGPPPQEQVPKGPEPPPKNPDPYLPVSVNARPPRAAVLSSPDPELSTTLNI